MEFGTHEHAILGIVYLNAKPKVTCIPAAGMGQRKYVRNFQSVPIPGGPPGRLAGNNTVDISCTYCITESAALGPRAERWGIHENGIEHNITGTYS